jgi:hypothetical protein
MPLRLYLQAKIPQYAMDRRLGGPRAGLDVVEKRKFYTARYGNLAIYPVARRYTD